MNSPLSQPLLQCLALLLCLEYFSSSRVVAQSGDGGGASGVEQGDIGGGPASTTQNVGAEGPDTGSVNLSKGATIAIAVVVSVVVILGGTMAVLFFMAKKRQWTMKETMRRSARKVSSAARAIASPLTPKKMTFSPIEKRQRNEASLKKANDELLHSKADNARKEKVGEQGSRSVSSSGSHRDLEKGLPESAVKVEAKAENLSVNTERVAKKDKKRPRPPSVSIPSSAFEMDSPKTPMWKKVFGR